MNLAILGGGISGMLAAYVFKSVARVTIFEAAPSLGGTYTSGGLKYVRDTKNFRNLLETLKIEHHSHQPRGALLNTLRTAAETQSQDAASLHPHPEFINSLPAASRLMWQTMHWQKTRGSMDGFKDTCMNDPAGNGSAPALAFNHKELIGRLASELEIDGVEIITNAKVSKVEPEFLEVEGRGSFPWSRLITTLPVPLMARLTPWAKLPASGRSNTLTVAFFDELPQWLVDLGVQHFDYTYTPLLSGVHRISMVNGMRVSWQAEASGKVSDAVFKEALGDVKIKLLAHMPGHLLSLEFAPHWPEGIAPIGRYAEWNSRATAEWSLDRAFSLRHGW